LAYYKTTSIFAFCQIENGFVEGEDDQSRGRTHRMHDARSERSGELTYDGRTPVANPMQIEAFI
jgi:hypothetical protein